MSGHTPGPWRWRGNWLSSDEKFGELLLYYTTNDDGVHCRNVADKALISAAPDLLAACKMFLAKPDSVETVDVARDYTDTDAAIDSMRAAVAKAEGAV